MGNEQIDKNPEKSTSHFSNSGEGIGITNSKKIKGWDYMLIDWR